MAKSGDVPFAHTHTAHSDCNMYLVLKLSMLCSLFCCSPESRAITRYLHSAWRNLVLPLQTPCWAKLDASFCGAMRSQPWHVTPVNILHSLNNPFDLSWLAEINLFSWNWHNLRIHSWRWKEPKSQRSFFFSEWLIPSSWRHVSVNKGAVVVAANTNAFEYTPEVRMRHQQLLIFYQDMTNLKNTWKYIQNQ